MAAAAFDRWMAEIQPDDPPSVRSAWLLTAVRRAPSDRLGRVWSTARPDELPVLVRGLAGRSADGGSVELPPSLRSPGIVPDLWLATAVARLHPPFAYGAPQDARIVAASLEEQLTAARLLAVPTVPWPDPAALELASPTVWPAIARSLAARGAIVAPEVWSAAVTLTGARCRLAPRLWCNAWRAVRDAAPRVPIVSDAVRAASANADAALLPAAVASSLRCENAAVVDRLIGAPDASLRCALPGFEWMAAAAQAAVWGAAIAPPRARLAALQAIRTSAHGQAQVLEAICDAAVLLPPQTAVPLVRALASERDPGVLAALLDALVLHVQHARLLGPAERAALERAPFELPEGPSLEARQHALALARLVGDPLPGDPGVTRALRQTWQPDGAVMPLTRAIPRDIPPSRIRFTMDIGSFDVSVQPSEAPEACAAIVGAARNHRYDGLTFHRIVPGFVAQGLDPRGDGFGGTDQPVSTELSTQHFDRGTIGVPLAGLDTGGIQLFVVLADAAHLDGRYPWVGRVERGMDVVDGLLPQDRVVRVEVIEP